MPGLLALRRPTLSLPFFPLIERTLGGHPCLRSVPYMPALSAVRPAPTAKAFYGALLCGAKKIQALCTVMGKYLTGLWAWIQAEIAFGSTWLFSEEHMKAWHKT